MISTDQIRKYPLFAGLAEHELGGLASCLTKRTFAKGAYLFYPGTPGLNTYLIESGLVRLFFTNAVGQEFMLNLIGPGEAFGLPLYQEDQLRVTGAAAHESSVILSISRDDIIRLMDGSPKLMWNIYQELNNTARKLLLHTHSLVTVSLDERLVIMLLSLIRKNKEAEVLDLPINQAEMAGWLGCSRGRLNRAMNYLQNNGIIRVDGQKIIILDRPGLERMTKEPIIDLV